MDTHRDSFVRFCAKEFGLDNYIAWMCCGAYTKNPTWKRLQTFYVTFLKEDLSPMPLNVGGKELRQVASTASSDPSKFKTTGFLGRTITTPPRNALEPLMTALRSNLADTYSRYRFVALEPGARYTDNKLGRAFGVFSEEMKTLKKTTTNDRNVLEGLGVLEAGGWPVRHMGLTGVVQGF